MESGQPALVGRMRCVENSDHRNSPTAAMGVCRCSPGSMVVRSNWAPKQQGLPGRDWWDRGTQSLLRSHGEYLVVSVEMVRTDTS